MSHNCLYAMVISVAMTITGLLPIAVQAASTQQPVTSSSQTPAQPDIEQLENFSEIFAHAKKFMDNPKTWDKIPAKVTL